MHQDIQNFSDITDIDTKGCLQIQLKLTRHGTTITQAKVNQWVLTQDQVRLDLDLFDAIQVEVQLLEFDEGVSGVEVALQVNDIEILPKYQHLSSNKKCYIDTFDPWTFTIPNNFYLWYHEVSGQGFIA